MTRFLRIQRATHKLVTRHMGESRASNLLAVLLNFANDPTTSLRERDPCMGRINEALEVLFEEWRAVW